MSFGRWLRRTRQSTKSLPEVFRQASSGPASLQSARERRKKGTPARFVDWRVLSRSRPETRPAPSLFPTGERNFSTGGSLDSWPQELAEASREARLIQALDADHRAELDAVDRRVNGEPPPVKGVPVEYDPESGLFWPV
jgi:hypothetical protein